MATVVYTLCAFLSLACAALLLRAPFFVSRRRDDVTIGSLGRLVRALDRAGRARAIRRRMPVYLTEFGIQSKPDPHYGVAHRRPPRRLAHAADPLAPVTTSSAD